MVKFGKKVVKFRIPIIIISILLLIPATLVNITVRQSRQSGVARATCPD